MQPAFHRQRIAGYATPMATYGARARARWQEGATLDIAQEMMRLTLAIVGKTLFDTDIESQAEEIGAALTDSSFGLIRGPRVFATCRRPDHTPRR